MLFGFISFLEYYNISTGNWRNFRCNCFKVLNYLLILAAAFKRLDC